VHQTDFACLSATRSVPTWSGLAARLTGLTALITASIERDRDGKRGINVLTAYFWRCSDADERIWSFNITIARVRRVFNSNPSTKYSRPSWSTVANTESDPTMHRGTKTTISVKHDTDLWQSVKIWLRCVGYFGKV